MIVVNDGSTDSDGRACAYVRVHGSRARRRSSGRGRGSRQGRGAERGVPRAQRAARETRSARRRFRSGRRRSRHRGRRRTARAERVARGGSALRRSARRRSSDGGRDRQRAGRPDTAVPGSRVHRVQPARPGGSRPDRFSRPRRQRAIHAARRSPLARAPSVDRLPDRGSRPRSPSQALGWHIRFCRTTSVTQQGVRTVRAWLRQRTRWAQGHYQCWDHIPKLLTRGDVPLVDATRSDALSPLRDVRDVRRGEPRCRRRRRVRVGRRSPTTSSPSCRQDRRAT